MLIKGKEKKRRKSLENDAESSHLQKENTPPPCKVEGYNMSQ